MLLQHSALCSAITVLPSPVHHARKGAAHERGGQALRGSSELHAWGDSNLYLRRHGQNLYLNIEHRAAPGTDRLQLVLKANPPALALELVEPSAAEPPDQASSKPSAQQRLVNEQVQILGAQHPILAIN
jgi:hypothetical protein